MPVLTDSDSADDVGATSDNEGSPSSTGRTNYEEVVAVRLAEEANHPEERLCSFRAEHLSGNLLGVQEIAGWIENQLAEDEWRVGEDERSPMRIISGYLAYPASVMKIGYGRETLWPDTIQSAPGTVLDELRRLSVHFCHRYRWDDLDATAFVLADRAPDFREFRATSDTESPIPATWKIELEVSPMMSPSEAAEEYQRIRIREFSAQHRRAQRIGAKQLMLAYMESVHCKRLGDSSRQKMEDWNFFCAFSGTPEFAEEWDYRSESNLRRDIPKARRDLIYRSYLTNRQNEQSQLPDAGREME
jgi:hypothetical protein